MVWRMHDRHNHLFYPSSLDFIGLRNITEEIDYSEMPPLMSTTYQVNLEANQGSLEANQGNLENQGNSILGLSVNFLSGYSSSSMTYQIPSFLGYQKNKLYSDRAVETTCLNLLKCGMEQEAIEIEHPSKINEDLHDGITGDDIFIGQEAFIINDSWTFPLLLNTLNHMFEKKIFYNPYFKEPIKQIIKIFYI